MPQRAQKTGYFIETQAHGIKMPSMHHHDLYELYFLHEGTREYFVEDSFFSVSAGAFVLIAPGKLHRTGGAYALRTLIMFSRECLLKVYTPEAADELLKAFDSIHILPPKELQQQAQKLLRSMEESDSPVQFAVYLGHMLCLLGQCREEKDCDPCITRIIRYINQNYSAIDKIDQIAQACFLSKYHLCHLFRRSMGMTVVDYLNQVRIRTACVHLSVNKLSIQQIATQCGFRSLPYFSTVFRKYIGCTPSEYRQQKLSTT